MRRLMLVAAVGLSAALACGRTEVLRYDFEPPDAGVDAGRDAGPDAGVDAGYDAGPPDAACEPRNLPLVPAVPTVMFVIDRSGSMTENLDGRSDAGPSRWTVLETSLRSVLPPLDQRIAMGALMYPVAGATCAVPASVDLSPALGNTSRMLALFSTQPIGGTPTAEAAAAAARHLATLRTASGARALVVTTDGAPNCNPALDARTCVCTGSNPGPVCNPQANCLDDVRTIAQLRNLFVDSKLPTYVVGLGSGLSRFVTTLNAMAAAGGVPRTDAGTLYYSASSQAELTDAFSRITAQLTRCTFLANGLGPNETFKVLVNGVEVPRGPSGWEWLDQANGELSLQGQACDTVANGGTAHLLVDCH